VTGKVGSFILDVRGGDLESAIGLATHCEIIERLELLVYCLKLAAINVYSDGGVIGWKAIDEGHLHRRHID
jgi:hypothetical protein